MSYLKHIEIAGVLEVGVDDVSQSIYHPTVEIVKVVDSDGNDWEPVPGPDPWDELVVAEPTRWSDHNDYSPNVEVFAHVAGFTGGGDETYYQYRWQYQAEGDSTWVAGGGWTSYNNNPVQEVSYTIPEAAAGGKVRLQSRARDETQDPVAQVMSNASAQSVAYLPLVVSSTTVSGLPYVGQTVTCAVPAVTGGKAPYTYSYMWLDEAGVYSPSNTTTLGAYDLGNIVNCYVGVTSADGQTGNTTTTNGVGPVLEPPVMSPATTKLNGEVVNQSEAHEVPAGTHNLEVVANAIPPDIQYQWSLRSGTGTLTQDPNDPSKATYTIGNGDVGPLIVCTLDSNISENTSVSWQLFAI